jgi:hypothetical protein
MTLDTASASPRVGAALAVLTFAVVRLFERGGVDARMALLVSLALLLTGLVWAVKGPHRLSRLSELYLWLAFILSIYYLDVLANFMAGLIGWRPIEVFRPIAIIQVLGVSAAVWVLGAWSSNRKPSASAGRLVRHAAGLFVVGAVVFWVGARTFPGLGLEQVRANPEGHLWTSASFMVATVVTIAGLALLTLALREAGDRALSFLGLALFSFGAVFWMLHLAIRMTVMIEAARAWTPGSAAPDWFEPWRAWAALLFALYSVLAYAGLAAYGAAWLGIGWRPRWIGWTCVAAGVLAVFLGGLPLFIHVPLWLMGVLTLTANPGGPGSRSAIAA